MRTGPDLSSVEAALPRILERSDGPDQHLTVSGPVGAGQRTLAYRLANDHDAVVIELPDIDDADASAHIAYKLARHAGHTIDEAEPLDVTIAAALRRLRDRRRVVVQVPRTWSLETAAADPERHGLQRRASRALNAMVGQRDVAIIVMGPRPERLRLGHLKHEFLPPASARTGLLRDATQWDGYSACAEALAKRMNDRHEVHPVRLRLAVGVVALSPDRVGEIAAALSVDGQLDVLVEDIVRAHPEVSGLYEALWRFSLMRAPLPRDEFLASVEPPAGHEALFTSCLAYGDSVIRTNTTVRSALRKELTRWGSLGDNERSAMHEHLAGTHARLDGKLDPNATNADTVGFWLEKVHHLATAGSRCADAWSRQEHLRPELLWERARTLSIQEREYASAAALYQRCTQLDPEDDYAWHYLAYNLDRAGVASERTEDAFRRARDHDPSNVWWNSRLVTFLIGQARYQDAEAAWRNAVREVTDSGAELVSRPEIALHLHRWVVEAWLRLGDVGRARAVFDEIPLEVRDQLTLLEAELADGEEAMVQGESVRPRLMPVRDRWTKQTALPEDELRAWYPGRVQDTTGVYVEILVVTPESNLMERRVFRKRVSREAWSDACRVPPQQGMFIEVGEYSEGAIRILPLPLQPQSEHRIDRSELRYLEQWARNAEAG